MSKIKTDTERKAELKERLIQAILQGNNPSKIIEILALPFEFYKEKYPLSWKKIEKNQSLVEFFARQIPQFNLEAPPEFVDVSFCYFLLKNNHTILLQRLLHEVENKNPLYQKPLITIPYRFVREAQDGQAPQMCIYYLPNYDGTKESENVQQKLNVKENSMQYYYYFNLPNYISLISREQALEQLRPYYLKDQAVKEFAKQLKNARQIDLLNGVTSLEPLAKENFDDTANIYGFGVTLTDDKIWEEMEAAKAKFEQDHPDLVKPKGE